MKPAFHPDFAIGSRVLFSLDGSEDSDKLLTGTIAGISFMHVIFSYIVTLEKPLQIEGFENWTAVIVLGSLIKQVLQ